MADQTTPTRGGARGEPTYAGASVGLAPRFVTICTAVAEAVSENDTLEADVLYGLDVLGRVWIWCDANPDHTHEGSVAGWMLLTNKVHVPGKKRK